MTAPVPASMARTRQAILDGALRAVAQSGPTRVSMTQIAEQAGVAKATLYNHFRTKDDVWAALVDREIGALGARLVQGARTDLAGALAEAALAVGRHPGRAALTEPAVPAALGRSPSQPGWAAAGTAVQQALAAAGAGTGPAAVDLVLRWLASQLVRPGDEATVRVQASLLAGCLS